MKRKAFLGAVLHAIFAVGLAASVLWSCNRRQESVVPIGAILPMTGSGAQYGEEVRKGIELALDEINSDGGIKGVPMRLILEDSATEAKTALSAFEKMTTNRQIQVIVTEVSGVVLALAPKVNEKKIILFNVGAQHPEVRECGPYVFSNIDDATVESKALAEFAFNRLKAKKAAVLYTNVAYGEGARAVFSDTFQKIGGTIVAEVPFNEDGLDYRAQIGEVQKASPEVVYLPGHTKDMAKVLKQSYEIGFKPQWLSYTPFEGPDVLTIAGAAAEGVIYSSLSLDYDNAPPITKRFFDKFKNKYTVAPGTYSATGYDAAILVANAVKSVGNDATKIREYFLSMPEFQGVSGPTKFLPNGAVEKPLIFKTVRNGRFEILDK